MSKLKFELIVDTTTGEISVVNAETGEVKSTSPKKSKPKKNESSEPTLTLEDNKYYLSQAAVDLMGVEPDDKIDIKYEKQGKDVIPVIGSDENFGTHGGNRLTKSNTVACRGSKNQELAKYGTKFTLIPHKTKDGIFILSTGEVKEEVEENFDLPDIDLQDLIDDTDAEITEVSSSMFQL